MATARKAKSATPAFDKLAALEEAVRTAQAAKDQAEAESRKANRRAASAAGPALEYARAVAAGEREPNPAEEAELEAAAVPRPFIGMRISGGIGGQPTVVYFDRRAEAAVAGAFEAVMRAENAVAAYVSEAAAELQAELRAKAEEARAELVGAYERFGAASARWAGVRNTWARHGERWGIAPAQLPSHPLGGEGAAALEFAFHPARGEDYLLPVPRERLEVDGGARFRSPDETDMLEARVNPWPRPDLSEELRLRA